MLDTEFGEIIVRVNARSKGFTFRVKEGHLVVSVPTYYREKELVESIERLRPKLRKLIQKAEVKGNAPGSERHIDWTFRIETGLLSFDFCPDSSVKLNACHLRKDMGHVTFCMHPDTDFDAEGMQQWLERCICDQIRSYAKGFLSARLSELSRQFNLPYKSLAINSAHGRWGSCGTNVQRGFSLSSKREYNIHLSLYVMLLPEQLQRLIMLHELTHTLEMNHSPRFHAKLNAMLDGQEDALNKQLKAYTTDIFCFAKK